jgi:undecaprenyl-diphosphatase
MSWWQGLLLGVVQGLTEFLPISSSGHLVVAEAAIGLRTPGVVVEVTLHVATLLAVVAVYWKALWGLARGAVQGEAAAWRYVALLAIGSVPAGLAGFLLQDWF